MGAIGTFVHEKSRRVVMDEVSRLYLCEYDRIVDFAFVSAMKGDGRQTVYLAIEDTRTNRVSGAVVLYFFRRESFGGYELVTRFEDESCGPVARRCPNRLLKQLSSTGREYALKWREDCAYYNRTRKDRFTW